MEEMSRNKKLRLLVTTKCPHHCPLCCNNSWNFDELPRVNRWNYQQIMITGGEPLIHPIKVQLLTETIRSITDMQSTNPEIFLYTSICDSRLDRILDSVNGIVLTPHNKDDVERFLKTNSRFLEMKGVGYWHTISLRLNLFKDIKEMLPEGVDLSLWKVKDMEWIKDCPVPEGEDFRRIENLW